jgi:hypothetical protein
LTFYESGENHQVGTDSTLPFQPVQDSRCGVIQVPSSDGGSA